MPPRKKKTDSSAVKAALTAPLPKDPEKTTKLTRRTLLHCGSTLLNLACSDRPYGGFPKGKFIHIVGDSNAGKTILSTACMAEASISSHFDEYEIYYDAPEDGSMIDVERMFGPKLAKRLKSPRVAEDGTPTSSETIEDMYYGIHKLLKKGKPIIYITDSIDALGSSAEDEKFDENATKHENGSKEKGSYGDGKAKVHSEKLRRLRRMLRKTGSILILISQTRDKINAVAFGDTKTHSGGRALKFYCDLQIWVAVKETMKKSVRGKQREIGTLALIKVKKNRLTGKKREVEMPIYHSTGIDDVGANVDYLLEEKHWSAGKAGIKAAEFEVCLGRDALIAHIEEENKQTELAKLVGKVWMEIEELAKVKRKNKYHQ